MHRTSALRLAAALTCLSLSGCGSAFHNDGEMFQRMAAQVAAIRIDEQPQSAAQTPQPAAAAQPLAIQVVERIEMPEAKQDGLRAALQLVQMSTGTPNGEDSGLRTAVKLAEPVLAMAAARAPVAPARESGRTVQLAAFPDQAAARAAWAKLTAAHPELSGRFQPRYERADLGSRGVWTRLKVGPVANATQAERLCKAAGAGRWCASAFTDPAA